MSVPIQTELRRTNTKKEKKLQKSYIADFNLLVVQDFSQAHYQVLLTTLLKEFIKLNVNMDIMIKNVKLVELNENIVIVFFEYPNFKDDLIEYKCL